MNAYIACIRECCEYFLEYSRFIFSFRLRLRSSARDAEIYCSARSDAAKVSSLCAITRRALNRDLLPQHEGRNRQHHGEAGADHTGDHARAEILAAAAHQGRYLVAIAGDQHLGRCRVVTLNDQTAVYRAPGGPPYHDLVNGVHRQVGYNRLRA